MEAIQLRSEAELFGFIGPMTAKIDPFFLGDARNIEYPLHLRAHLWDGRVIVGNSQASALSEDVVFNPHTYTSSEEYTVMSQKLISFIKRLLEEEKPFTCGYGDSDLVYSVRWEVEKG